MKQKIRRILEKLNDGLLNLSDIIEVVGVFLVTYLMIELAVWLAGWLR